MAVLSKSDAIKRLSEATNTTQKDAETHLQAFLDLVRGTLHNGDDLRFIGFGTFSVQDVAAREGRHPQTGAPLHIPASKRVKFSVGKDLDDAIATLPSTPAASKVSSAPAGKDLDVLIASPSLAPESSKDHAVPADKKDKKDKKGKKGKK
jgi:nucleoid DNA-binding protein